MNTILTFVFYFLQVRPNFLSYTRRNCVLVITNNVVILNVSHVNSTESMIYECNRSSVVLLRRLVLFGILN